jgi:bifunctional non-homologous end joining protein LigD
MATRKTSTKPPSSSDAVDEQLARYRSMRDFNVTAEPAGKAKSTKLPALPFCIQKHAASHLHYDFRLGWNGVLKSWACAKGPSYNVKDRRLAVQVEDHPIEYGGFEGIIPAGQYGGGTVMLWDQGTWEPQPEYPDVDAGLRDGHLKFLMHGAKMQGKWALIRMTPRPKETKPNWLLIKEHDEFERPPEAPAVTDAEPNSVVTGRSLEQIASAEDHVWNSNRPEKPQPTSKVRVPHLRSSSTGPEVGETKSEPAAFPELTKLPEELQPTFLKPQLAVETKAPPDTSGWLYELKLDGYRIQARKDGEKVALLTRSGLDWTARMSAIAVEIAKLPCEAVTLDGEVVVLAPDGTSNFADLQASFQEGAKNPLTYFCFDLLHLNGRNPRDLPLIERKKLLADLLQQANADHVQLSEHLESHGVEMFHRACEMRAEGIVSKRASGTYSGTRSSDWLKSKCLHEQEFVIGGYTWPGKGKAGGPGIGALLLGYYDDKQTLIYAGRTGTGFTQRFAATLRKRLEAIETPKTPFATIASEARRGALWVQPTMVAQVRFATWTADDQVRQAAFLGLREDKPADEVRRETAAPTPKSEESKNTDKKTSVPHSSRSHRDEWEPLDHPPIRLTHPEKILDPASRLTKQQLADFYWAVSEAMLPHLAGRALSLVRVPEGIDHEHFYQKHVTHMLPPGFDSVPVPDKKTRKIERYIALHTREAIASLAQISVLEVHPWGSLASDLEKPDRLVIDLDPDESLPWTTLADAALDVKKRLKSLGLESFLKTTGGKGLHVVIPIEPELEWPAVKDFCHSFVLAMEKAKPGLYLTKMTKAARTGKIYLDYLRNERGATAVAPWSPRARPNAGVAVPLSWSELKLPKRPIFTIGNFAEWRSRLKKDPWAKLFVMKQSITTSALQTLGKR